VDVSGRSSRRGAITGKYTINSAQLVHLLVFRRDSLPGVVALDNLGIPKAAMEKVIFCRRRNGRRIFLAKLQDADGGFYFLVYPRDRANTKTRAARPRGPADCSGRKTPPPPPAAVAALAQCSSSPLFQRQFPQAASRLFCEGATRLENS